MTCAFKLRDTVFDGLEPLASRATGDPSPDPQLRKARQESSDRDTPNMRYALHLSALQRTFEQSQVGENHGVVYLQGEELLAVR